MPPQDQSRPEADEAASFVAGMRQRSGEADLQTPADPGRVTMRRLNRVEYRNTIRDLVGVDFELASIMEPFASVKQKLTVLSGLAADKARAHGDSTGRLPGLLE